MALEEESKVAYPKFVGKRKTIGVEKVVEA
jgi:hypothetical protein